MTDTATRTTAPPTCAGNYLLPIQDPTSGDWGVVDCPGCPDCDREVIAARLAARPGKRGFALLPACDDLPEW
jgi:hypothetical protein